MSPLFRPEAVDGQRQSWLGEVRLVRPVSLTLLTALAVGIAALVVGFLFGATYTRQARLEGALTAAPGPAQAPVLRAILYAPPATVGQLRADQPVRLRYEAFAGQLGGGPASGRILQVERTPTLAGECAGCGAGPVWYRVIVALDAQGVAVDGREHPLAAGMRVDADVMIERRRLIEWLVEPSRAAAPHGA